MARMDSVIEQLQNSRTLLRQRIDSIRIGGEEHEKRISAEFDRLRRLMVRREQELVNGLREKVRHKMLNLSALNRDLLLSLQRVQRSKVEAQALMETDQEPRVSRQQWRALMARKQRVSQIVDETLNDAISSKQEIAELIVSSKSISLEEMTPFLAPKERNISNQSPYDVIHPFSARTFLKNWRQILVETTVPGFAAHFEDKMDVHRVCNILEFLIG